MNRSGDIGLRDKVNVERYSWGDGCDGWRMVDTPDLSVIEERMPSGASEKLHYHARATQYFHVLSGAALFEVDGEAITVQQGQGICITPGQQHCVSNRTAEDLRFLLTSAPTTRGDRIEVEP
jgi:mannose-6-phosphate isomerase-like protein (cupin superfamily)